MFCKSCYSRTAVVTLVLLISSIPYFAQPNVADVAGALHWRNIGPHRGGRTRAITGVRSRPNVFYMAPNNGGVWKTTDAGRVWVPIFDDQPTGSVGALAVAGTDPNVIYVGSGEGLHRPDLSIGDGIYKSIDGGRTWTRLEQLRDGQQIAEIIVDPKDANKLLVAVAGHPFGPNEERGIYRSTNGGKTFEKVLGKGPDIGGWDLVFDPTNSNTVYASLWESREGPWENARWDATGAGIFKSLDGGKTWQQLKAGLPDGITQASLAVAPSNARRLFAAVRTPESTKFYRSENAGESWSYVETDTRPTNRIASGDLGDIQFDPKNADVVYVASIVTWKSIDFGKTWTAFRGAPGGDDYQNIWINPTDGSIMAMSSDQGAIITLNGGKTWSSWYNQSTAQMYHVNADNAFPYRLCSGQQESGSACVSSRGDYGEVTFREWTPVGAEEYGYVVPDPLDPDIVYGGKLTRFDRRTGQTQIVLPVQFRGPDFRMIRTQPIIFSPVDNKTLFFAGNTMWKTTDGGNNWQKISPDLTRKTWDIPKSVGSFTQKAQVTQRGVIYAIAPSFQDIDRIWAGTDDGLIHMTTDGGNNWRDVTPPAIAAWQKISILEAGHFDKDTAYAAVNTLRLDDNRPHIYRTYDGGVTWKEIVNGIPNGQTVNVVREDPVRKGLLYAGTERTVYVSFDDGDNWQSLRLDMPATSIRDLIVKGDDLAVGTHGRGFWILDNITALRQLDAKKETRLFAPQTAVRVRWNLNTDTPLPPDEPSGENPPDGAAIDYYLVKPAKDVEIEIHDAAGNLVRRYRSDDALEGVKDTNNVPAYWIRPPKKPSTTAGAHRFMWDIHHTPIRNIRTDYPIAAIYANTAPVATSPWAHPGKYKIALKVDGEVYLQELTLTMDPRVKTSSADLQKQFELSMKLYKARLDLEPINERINSLAMQLDEARKRNLPSDAVAQIDALLAKLGQLAGVTARRPGTQLSLSVIDRIATLFDRIQDVDLAPTVGVENATLETLLTAEKVIQGWKQLNDSEIPAMQKLFVENKLPPLKLTGWQIKYRLVGDEADGDDDPRTKP